MHPIPLSDLVDIHGGNKAPDGGIPTCTTDPQLPWTYVPPALPQPEISGQATNID